MVGGSNGKKDFFFVSVSLSSVLDSIFQLRVCYCRVYKGGQDTWFGVVALV